jgi:hypothetical protein
MTCKWDTNKYEDGLNQNRAKTNQFNGGDENEIKLEFWFIEE